MVLALFTTMGAWAQDEDPLEQAIVHTKSLQAVIDDARFLLTCESYTTGQSSLESAVLTAESDFDSFADDEAVREAIVALQEAIDAFMAENEVIDATEKVQNPNLDKDSKGAIIKTGWVADNIKQKQNGTAVNTSGKTLSYFAEQWAKAPSTLTNGNIYQKVTGMPAGHYRLVADCLATMQGTDLADDIYGVELYLNDKICEIGLTALPRTAENMVTFGLDTDIKSGDTLTIGFRFSSPNANWVGFGNVKLYYVGTQDDWDASMDVERIAAARATLNAAITAAKEAKARDNAVFYKDELQTAIDDAQAAVDDEASELTTLEDATSTLNEEVKYYNTVNTSYARLQTAIADAEELAKTMTEGLEEFQQAIETAKTAMSSTIEAFEADPDYAYFDQMVDQPFNNARAALNDAMSKFRMSNASYAHPANVITNGDMASSAGWDILKFSGTNPDLKINSSGDYELFSKPFMECWIASGNKIGQENYARQTVTKLPDGQALPKGYYILKAAALATQQGDANLVVSGVQIRMNDQSVDVHTANGKPELYTLSYELTEDNSEITIGLYIDETTTANWIAWDEVELQFVGPKDKYLADKATDELGQVLKDLKTAVAEAKTVLEGIDANGVDLNDQPITAYIAEGDGIIANPSTADAEWIGVVIQKLAESIQTLYLSGVSPKEGHNFDFTNQLVNPNFDVDAAGWSLEDPSTMVLPSASDCVYWWFGSRGPESLVQDVHQTIKGMPAGNYLLKVRAAIRLGGTYRVDEYTDEKRPTIATDYSVYANEESTLIHPFFYVDEEKGLTLESMMAMTNDYDYAHGNGTLITNMLKGDNDYYDTYLPFTLDAKGDIKIGFRVEIAAKNGSMPFFDYFNLFYYGANEVDINGIAAPSVEDKVAKTAAGVYSLNGQLLRRNTSVEGLPKGLYIVGGRKVVIK